MVTGLFVPSPKLGANGLEGSNYFAGETLFKILVMGKALVRDRILNFAIMLSMAINAFLEVLGSKANLILLRIIMTLILLHAGLSNKL